MQLTCNTHQTTAGGLTLSLPNVCTASPLRGKAVSCKDYCSLLEKEASHVPTRLKEFLHYCHALRTGVRHNCTELHLVFLLETDNPPDDGPLCESNVVSDQVEAAIRQLPSSTVPVEQSAAASQGT